MGAGAGAFIGSLFGNGGWGGWGNGRNAGQVGADVAIQTGLQNLSDQVHNNGLTGLQSANGVQQAVSNAAAGVTIYVYAVEAIRPPRVATEQPSMLLYQWFSTVQIDFNPSMITPKEWLKANVYAAPIIDSRMSKLLAICKIKSENTQPQSQEAPAEEDKLIHVEGITDGSSRPVQRNKKARGEGQPSLIADIQ